MSSPAASWGVLLVLRAVYFLGCRRYVHRSLLCNIRQVLREDAGVVSRSDRSRTGSGYSETGASSAATSPGHTPVNGGGSWPWTSGKAKVDRDVLPMTRYALGATPPPHERRAPHPGANGGTGAYRKGAALMFCWAFCEGSLLFSLVLLGGFLDPATRRASWTLSLGLLIALIVFIVPLAECLLLSASLFGSTAHPSERPRLLAPRTIIFTSLPFAGYLFVFYRVGQTMQGLLGVSAGSHHFGFFNTTLARICVPGVFLIASLSGGGAVNTAWEAWEWRRLERRPPITLAHIGFAEEALERARADLRAREEELDALVSREEPGGGNSAGGMWGMFKSSGSSKTSQLSLEISGLRAMESQMTRDLGVMRRRKASREYGRTLQGTLLNMANWAFSFYCVYRIFTSCVNLVFGYSSRTASSSSPTSPTDVATALLARLLASFSVELDAATLSRLVGLALLGGIIVVNMRAVLAWGSRLFKVTSAGTSAGFMLLALAQLMAIYLLTCLISLPSSSSAPDLTSGPASSSDDLLATLPSFRLFTRLFDLVFLLAAGATLAVRWLGRQLADDEAFGGEFHAAGGV